jgi:hypothetical protein
MRELEEEEWREERGNLVNLSNKTKLSISSFFLKNGMK